MDDTIITTYYLCEEFLKAIGHTDDRQVRLSTAEVMCTALLAAAFFGGNIEKTRSFLEEYGYINKAISKSRFNRRLHAIDPRLWRTLFDVLGEAFKHSQPGQTYVVDSLPVPVCDKHPHQAVSNLSSRGAWRGFSRLRCEQTALFLRFAGTSSGERVG